MDLENIIEECKRIANSKGFIVTWDNCPTFLMLIVTELSEAMECWRDNNLDGFKIELGDTLIRLFHLIGDLNMVDDIPLIIQTKLDYNKTRKYLHGRVKL